MGSLQALASCGEILRGMNCERSTGFFSEIGTKLHDWAVGQAGAGCYSLAALSSND